MLCDSLIGLLYDDFSDSKYVLKNLERVWKKKKEVRGFLDFRVFRLSIPQRQIHLLRTGLFHSGRGVQERYDDSPPSVRERKHVWHYVINELSQGCATKVDRRPILSYDFRRCVLTPCSIFYDLQEVGLSRINFVMQFITSTRKN